MNKKWTPEEIEILKKYYPKEGMRYCMQILGRAKGSVVTKAFELNLKAPGIRPTAFTHQDYENKLLEKELDFFPVESYITAKIAILHECFEGHQWKATPDNLLRERTGCPICAKYGFDPSKPAILYYIKLERKEEIYYKIGITNRTVEQRFIQEKDKIITVLFQKEYLTGFEARNKERELLNKYKPITVQGFMNGTGKTELFSTDIFNGRFVQL